MLVAKGGRIAQSYTYVAPFVIPCSVALFVLGWCDVHSRQIQPPAATALSVWSESSKNLCDHCYLPATERTEVSVGLELAKLWPRFPDSRILGSQAIHGVWIESLGVARRRSPGLFIMSTT